ncbi:MAG: zinc ABC transporter ATP-binding protein ZnuC, partial [Deltaproteobacteria bacterium]
MNDSLVVTVRGLATRLGGRPVLEGIDLEVRRGEVVAIIGPSGGG